MITIIREGVNFLPQNKISVKHSFGQAFYSYVYTDKGIILTPSKALMELTTIHEELSDITARIF